MLSLSECTKNNLCADCEEDGCMFKGKIRADCPKYKCDRDELGFEHCESCAFMKSYAKSQREYFATLQQEEQND